MVIGPFRTIAVGGGQTANFYLLRYDAAGQLLSPQTAEMLREELPNATDIYIFSYGWNTDFKGGAADYQRFIDGYLSQAGPPRPGRKPLLIGVIWPSISFLMPWEDGPQIAADSRAGAAQTEEMRRLISEGLEVEKQAALSELIDGRDGLDEDDARTAAVVVRDALWTSADPDGNAEPPSTDDLLETWRLLDGGSASKPADPDVFGDAGNTDVAADPQAAAGLGRLLDVRNLLRMGTVWKMKDRAGAVGAHGVAPLIGDVLNESKARLHLIGHSFGARLLLSALALAPASPRKARSVLLLQPAVNRWCFAGTVIGTGKAGGYHSVLSRVEQPILTTMSTHDFPLHDVFHLALRGGHLGEPDIAAIGDTGRFGALGGYGPAGVDDESSRQTMIKEGVGTYDLAGGVRIITVDGSGEIDGAPGISGHGDINTPRTWWALHCLASTA